MKHADRFAARCNPNLGSLQIKKTIAILAELIPVVSAPLSYLLVVSSSDSALVRGLIPVTFLLAFLGFAFFLLGRKLAKEERIVRILGIFDWFATLYVIGFYTLAVFLFAQ